MFDRNQIPNKPTRTVVKHMEANLAHASLNTFIRFPCNVLQNILMSQHPDRELDINQAMPVESRRTPPRDCDVTSASVERSGKILRAKCGLSCGLTYAAVK